MFPASTFEEALRLGQAVQEFAAGQRIRRLTLFENLGKSPDSGASRQLVINSNKYGITKGSYAAEWIELTPDGNLATSPDTTPEQRARARFKLAIEGIPPFKALNDQLRGNKLPAKTVLRDLLREQGVEDEATAECADTFVVNAKFVGVLRTIAGAERVLPIEQVIEELPKEAVRVPEDVLPRHPATPSAKPLASEGSAWDKICFYITPIGAEDSEQRKHSDLFLSNLIEPALESFDLKVIRADHIGKPGMITAQIIEHIVLSKLVIADLSYHNPNVFYELSLRHACRLPTVQIIRSSDGIPFDLDQFRTIQIDTTNIYTLVPKLETYKAEIANQVRRALSDPDSVGNPLTTFYPGLKMEVPRPTGTRQGT